MIPHEDHIWELADELGATVRWSRARKYSRRTDGSHGGTAYGYDREIVLGWRASGEDAYWTALHELGHIALGHMGLPETPEGTAGEADAWLWALEHARVPPSTGQRIRVDESIQTYAERRGHHPRVVEAHRAYLVAARGGR